VAGVAAAEVGRLGEVSVGRRGRLAALIGALGVVAVVLFVASPVSAADHAVALQNNLFVPKALTVAQGDKVVWTDNDAAPHSVTSDDGSFASPGDCSSPATCMKLGDTFEHTFATPGTYAYYCKIHGGPGGAGMAGTVTVTGGSTTSRANVTTTTKRPTTTTKRATAVSPTPGKGTSTTISLFRPGGVQPGLPTDSTVVASVTDPLVTTTTAPPPPAAQAAVVIREDRGGDGKERNVPLLLVATAALGGAAAGALSLSRRGPGGR
jgi:plastocyanin